MKYAKGISNKGKIVRKMIAGCKPLSIAYMELNTGHSAIL